MKFSQEDKIRGAHAFLTTMHETAGCTVEELINLLDPRMIRAMLNAEQEEPEMTEKKDDGSFLNWWNSSIRGYQSFGTPKRAAASAWAELSRRDSSRLKVVITEMSESNNVVTYGCYLTYESRETLADMVEHGYQFYSSRVRGRAKYEAECMRHMLARSTGVAPDVLDFDTDLPPNRPLEEVATGLGLIRHAGAAPITVEDLQELIDVTHAEATARIEHLEALLTRAQDWMGANNKKWPATLMNLIAKALGSRATAMPLPKSDDTAFDAGWRMAAEWAKRGDLLADMDSQAFKCEKLEALGKAGRPQPASDTTCMDAGPWAVCKNDNGSYSLQSEDFTYDVRLAINGEFGEDKVREKYAQFLADQLNTKHTKDANSARLHWLLKNMGAAFDSDTRGHLIVYRSSFGARRGLRMARGKDWESCIDQAMTGRGEWISG